MKKLHLILIALFLSITVFSQSQIDSLVKVGIELHDNEQYEWAIDVYKKALKLDANSTLVNYEMAMTYMYMGDYKKSIQHCDLVIAEDTDFLMPTFMIKAAG